MVGQIMLHAVNRALGGAVDGAARKASWMGLAVFAFVIAILFGLAVAFWALASRYDVMTAGIIMGIASLVVALVSMMMPKFLDWVEAKSTKPVDPVAETMAVVKEEVDEAVDYFGPIRVLSSSLLLGLGLAKSVKQLMR